MRIIMRFLQIVAGLIMFIPGALAIPFLLVMDSLQPGSIYEPHFGIMPLWLKIIAGEFFLMKNRVAVATWAIGTIIFVLIQWFRERNSRKAEGGKYANHFS